MSGSVFVYDGARSYEGFLNDNKTVEGVNLLVNMHMAKSLATQNDLARRGIETVERVGAETRAELARVNASVARVERAVEDLGGIVQHGFHKISRELNDIAETLTELVKIAKSPDQTWAFEQYSIAGEAYERGHIAEALDYVTRAIEGHRDRPGFRLEHRFYALRGLIRLGGPGHFAPEIVDLDAAVEDFRLAINYAGHAGKGRRSRYENLAGWACYCAGRMKEARAHLERAVELRGTNPGARYDLAKLLLHEGEVERGFEEFKHALRADWLYGIRAAADGDFTAHPEELELQIAVYRAGLRAKIAMSRGEFKRLDYRRRQALVAGHGIAMSDAPAAFFEMLERDEEGKSVAELLELSARAPEVLDEAEREVVRARAKLTERQEEARGQRTNVNVDVVIFLVVFFCGLLGLVLGWAGVHLIFGLVLMVGFGFAGMFLGPLVVVPLSWLIAAIFVKAKAIRTSDSLGRVVDEFGDPAA